MKWPVARFRQQRKHGGQMWTGSSDDLSPVTLHYFQANTDRIYLLCHFSLGFLFLSLWFMYLSLKNDKSQTCFILKFYREDNNKCSLHGGTETEIPSRINQPKWLRARLIKEVGAEKHRNLSQFWIQIALWFKEKDTAEQKESSHIWQKDLDHL